jgi:hypothetical protein
MSGSQWHKLHTSNVAASPELLFELLSDMPNHSRWLPGPGGVSTRSGSGAASSPASRIIAIALLAPGRAASRFRLLCD